MGLRPTQWFTPTRGLSNRRDRVRATSTTDCNGAPIPGPMDYHISKVNVVFNNVKKRTYPW